MAIKQIVVEVIRKTGQNDNGKYDLLSYHGFDNKGKKVQFKFTRAVTNRPSEQGKFVIEVESTNMNKDETTRFNEYWIKKIESVKPYVAPQPVAKDEVPF